MTDRDLLIPVVVLSVLRCDMTVRGAADRLGATEAQIREWVDVFVVAGVLSLNEYRHPSTIRPEPSRSTTPRAAAPAGAFYSTRPPCGHDAIDPPPEAKKRRRNR